MTRLLAGLFMLSAVAVAANGQAQPAQSAATQIPIETMIAKSVGFISVPYRGSDGKTQSVSGTCFFVVVPDQRLGKEGAFVYVVTNRHVATAEGVDPGLLLPRVDVYVNRQEPENGSMISVSHITLQGTDRWFFPDDKSVDLAVLPRAPIVGKDADVVYVPISNFVTQNDMKLQQIGVGDSVSTANFRSVATQTLQPLR